MPDPVTRFVVWHPNPEYRPFIGNTEEMAWEQATAICADSPEFKRSVAAFKSSGFSAAEVRNGR